jgi:hypothetical protein
MEFTGGGGAIGPVTWRGPARAARRAERMRMDPTRRPSKLRIARTGRLARIAIVLAVVCAGPVLPRAAAQCAM